MKLKDELIQVFEEEIQQSGGTLTKKGRNCYELHAKGKSIALLIYQVDVDEKKKVPQKGRWSTNKNKAADLPKKGGIIYLVGQSQPLAVRERFGLTKDEFLRIEPSLSIESGGNSYRIGRPTLADKKFETITDFLGRF